MGCVDCGLLAAQWSPDEQALVLVTGNPNSILILSCFYVNAKCVTFILSMLLLLIMAWSARNTLLLMTSRFDVISETPLHSSDFGEHAPVSVGWGRKETQFHGRAGKQAAQSKQLDSATLSADDDLLPRLSWRGDGAFFCCSTVDPNGGSHRLWLSCCI